MSKIIAIANQKGGEGEEEEDEACCAGVIELGRLRRSNRVIK